MLLVQRGECANAYIRTVEAVPEHVACPDGRGTHKFPRVFNEPNHTNRTFSDYMHFEISTHLWTLCFRVKTIL